MAAGAYVNQDPGGGSLTLNGSTFSGNVGTAGGAIFSGNGAGSGMVTVNGSTLAGNRASAGGGGAIYLAGGTLVLNGATLTGNTALASGGGVGGSSGTLSMTNTIVSGNSGPSANDIDAGLSETDRGGNVVGAGSVGLGAALGPLGFYGGPTQTVLPEPGSAAICAGGGARGGTLDQRGASHGTYTVTPCVDSGAVQTSYALAFSHVPGSMVAGASFVPQPVVAISENGLAYTASSPVIAVGDTASPTALTGTYEGTLGISGRTAAASDSLTATLAVGAAANAVVARATAVSGSFSVVVASYAMPTTNVGATSATQTVTLTLTVNATLNATLGTAVRVLTVGTPNLDFQYVAGGTCAAGTKYTAGQSCTVKVAFAPRYAGERLGAVVLLNDAATPVAVATEYLSGVALGSQGVFALGSAVETKLATIGGLADFVADEAGNLWVMAGRSISKVNTTSGAVATVFAGVTAGQGLVLDGAGNVFYGDSGNEEVDELVGGVGPPVAIAPISGLTRAMAIDPQGNVYAYSAATGFIDKIAVVTHAVSQVVAVNEAVQGIAFDETGDMFYTGAGSGAIYEVAAGTAAAATYLPAGSLAVPGNLALDPVGNVYVASDGGHGSFTQVAVRTLEQTESPNGVGPYFGAGLAMDHNGDLYSGADDTGAIYKFSRSIYPVVTFPNTAIGTRSAQVVVPLVNDGNANLSFSSVLVSPNFNLAGSATTCTASSAVAPGATCALGVEFAPTALGATTGTASVTASDTGTSQVVPLSGTAMPGPATQLTVSAPGMAMAGTAIGFTVVALDAYGNTATGYTGTIHFSSSDGAAALPGNATLTGGVGSYFATLNTPGTQAISVANTVNGTVTGTSGGVVVSGVAPAISFAVTNRTFGDAMFVVGASSNSAGAFTYSVVSGPSTISGATVTLTGAGTVVLQAAQAASGIYTAGSETASFTVAPEVPTLVFAAIPAHLTTDAPITVAANSASPGAVTYAVVSGPATVSGSTVTLTGVAGLVVLQANQAAAGNYTAATAQTSFGVNALVVPVISFVVANHTFGDAAFLVGASSNSTGAFSYSVVSGPATVSGNTVTLTGAGTVVLQASEAATGTYAAGSAVTSFTVAPAVPVISFVVANHTYGDAAFVVDVRSNSGGAMGFSVISGPAAMVGNMVTLTGAGTVVLMVAQEAAGPYTGGSAEAVFTVARATPVLAWVAPGAIAYGTALSGAELDATAAGVGRGALAGSFAYTPGPGVVPPPGSQTLTTVFTPEDGTDYMGATASVMLAVTAGTLTVSGSDASRVYGTANPAFTGTIAGQQNGDTFTESFTTPAGTLSDAGTYPIVPAALGSHVAFYNQTVQNGTLTIVPAKVTGTLTAGAVSGTAGVSNSFTATIVPVTSGVPSGTVQLLDNGTVFGSAALAGGQAVLNSAALPVGTHAITAVYSGDKDFNALSLGGSVVVTVGPPDFTIVSTVGETVAIHQGETARFVFHLTPLAGSYYEPLEFSYTAVQMPLFSEASFSPQTVAANSGPVDVTFTVQTIHYSWNRGPGAAGGEIALALMLLPLTLARRGWRRMGRSRVLLSRGLRAGILILGSLGASVAMAGCGTGYTDKMYPVTITATAGGVVHSTVVVIHLLQTPQ